MSTYTHAHRDSFIWVTEDQVPQEAPNVPSAHHTWFSWGRSTSTAKGPWPGTSGPVSLCSAMQNESGEATETSGASHTGVPSQARFPSLSKILPPSNPITPMLLSLSP